MDRDRAATAPRACRALAPVEGTDSGFVVGKRTAVGPGWSKGPLDYPVLDQWRWQAHPQPIGDVYAFAAVPGGMYFSSATGVYFEDHRSGLRELRSPSSTTEPKSTPFNAANVNAISFVDREVGFGVVDGDQLFRTSDGGGTWTRVGALPTAGAIHFENPSDGVAWGNGPMQVTTDGGASWSYSSGPVDNELTWADGRLWAFTPCVQSTPCGSRPVLVSDDVGRTWQQTAPLRMGFGYASVVATSRTDAYVVEPATDEQYGPWQVARTDDGGASWSYQPLPCPHPFTWHASLAFNGDVYLLACTSQPAGGTTAKRVFTSSDGRNWERAAYIPGQSAVVANFGSTFISDPGRSAPTVLHRQRSVVAGCVPDGWPGGPRVGARRRYLGRRVSRVQPCSLVQCRRRALGGAGAPTVVNRDRCK